MRIRTDIDPDADLDGDFFRDELLHADDPGAFWDREPSAKDLAALEKIGRRRAEIHQIHPIDEHEATIVRHLLQIFDEMEEAVVLQGHDAPSIVEGWETLEALATFRKNGGPPDGRG